MMFIVPAFLLILISVPTQSDRAWEKIVVNFPCETDFIRFAVVEPTVCRNPSLTGGQGRVSCLDGGRLQKNSGPGKFVFLDKPLVTDNRLVIIGTPLKDTLMQILLVSHGDSVLYMAVRFNHENMVKCVILNSEIGGHWGKEMRADTFPFAVDEQFNTTIVVKASEYQIFVNDVLMNSFDFRDPHPTVTKIRFLGDLLVRSLLVD